MLKGVRVNIVPHLDCIIVVNNCIAICDVINDGIFMNEIDLSDAGFKKKYKGEHDETQETFSHRWKVSTNIQNLKRRWNIKQKREHAS